MQISSPASIPPWTINLNQSHSFHSPFRGWFWNGLVATFFSKRSGEKRSTVDLLAKVSLLSECWRVHFFSSLGCAASGCDSRTSSNRASCGAHGASPSAHFSLCATSAVHFSIWSISTDIPASLPRSFLLPILLMLDQLPWNTKHLYDSFLSSS